jgi:hypothetical protein
MYKTTLLLSATAAFAATLIGACSSSSPSPPFPDVASFCQAKAKEECQIAPTCAVDTTACEAVRAQKCNADASAATSTGTRTYNQGAAQGCIDKVHAVYGAGKVLLSDLQGDGSMGDVCARVFAGQSDKNKPCTTDYDCANGRICSPVQPGSTAQMVCADKTPKNAGDFCADPGSVCATGTFCSAPAGGGAAQCQARAATGAQCSATTPCLETLRCNGGTCADRATPGQACTTNDDCSSQAGYCDGYAGNICTIGLTFATGALDCRGFGSGGLPDAGGGQDVSTQDVTVNPDTGAASDAPQG